MSVHANKPIVIQEILTRQNMLIIGLSSGDT